MATTTRVALLELLSEQFGDWWSQVTTAAGSATTTVDTKLAQLSADDDFCLNWYVRKVATGEVRRVTGGYTASTNTITHAAFAAAVGSGNTYELHRLNPDHKHNALARASILSYPKLYLPLRDESLMVDDLLSNSGFEEALSGGAHPSWTNVGSPTVTADTTTVWHGSQSAKVVAGVAAGQLTQAPAVNVTELAGLTATFKMRGWASAASTVRLRLDWDGTTIVSGSYHTGDRSWRLLTVSGTVPTDATQVKAICEVAASGTGYFDKGYLKVKPLYKQTVPTSFITGPLHVYQQYDEGNPVGLYNHLLYQGTPTEGRILRLEGMGLLSQPSTDAGTVEIGSPYTEYFISQAARWLYRTLSHGGSQQEREYLAAFQDRWGEEIARLERTPGMTMRRMSAEDCRGKWHLEEDSSGRYLIFDQVR